MGVVTVIRSRRKARAQCTCGWNDKPRWLMSGATTRALIHAAQNGCHPASPLVLTESASGVEPLDNLLVGCPISSWMEVLVQRREADTPANRAERAALSPGLTSESAELDAVIQRHLETCTASKSSTVTAIRTKRGRAEPFH